MPAPSLLDPLPVGPYELAHRVVMAPLTRMRATAPPRLAARDLNAAYYRQRATPGGLIIAEATQVSPVGQGSPDTPGIHTAEQIAGWRGVTEAIHEEGGLVFAQLWHVGRISHRAHQPGGALPVAPSAVAPGLGKAMLPDFSLADYETPRALELEEIPEIVGQYVAAARNAHQAGFDGVEVHAANGYLIQQFLETRTNRRTDAYGGTPERRMRFLLEILHGAMAVWGPGRVGIRLSPSGGTNDSGDHDAPGLYRALLERLAPLGLAYLHMIEPRAAGAGRKDPDDAGAATAARDFRAQWPGVLMLAGGYTPGSAAAAVAAGDADAIAFGRAFISNPDLPERIRRGLPLEPYDRATFYGGDHRGYTDYAPHPATT